MTAFPMIVAFCGLYPTPKYEHGKLDVLRSMSALEHHIASASGEERRARFREDQMTATTSGEHRVDLRDGDTLVRYLIFAKEDLSGVSSGFLGRSSSIGNMGSGPVNRRTVDESIANRIRTTFFETRYEEFKSTTAEAMAEFVDGFDCEFDSYSVYFEEQVVEGKRVGVKVNLTGYLNSVPSLECNALIGGDGIIAEIALTPGVFSVRDHAPSVSVEEVLTIINGTIKVFHVGNRTVRWNGESCSWSNTTVLLQYYELGTNLFDRNQVSNAGWSLREDHPVYLVTVFSREGEATIPSLTLLVDGISGIVYGPVWNAQLSQSHVVRHMTVFAENERHELFLSAVPRNVQWNNRTLTSNLFGQFEAKVSDCTHYIRLGSGDYYSPKPIRATN